jgi:hypothetical protein
LRKGLFNIKYTIAKIIFPIMLAMMIISIILDPGFFSSSIGFSPIGFSPAPGISGFSCSSGGDSFYSKGLFALLLFKPIKKQNKKQDCNSNDRN